MIAIADTRSWTDGPYTIQQKPRLDSPSWPVYVVFRGERLVGKSFSLPSESDCRWLELHCNGDSTQYAPSAAHACEKKFQLRGIAVNRSLRSSSGGKRRTP